MAEYLRNLVMVLRAIVAYAPGLLAFTLVLCSGAIGAALGWRALLVALVLAVLLAALAPIAWRLHP